MMGAAEVHPWSSSHRLGLRSGVAAAGGWLLWAKPPTESDEDAFVHCSRPLGFVT